MAHYVKLTHKKDGKAVFINLDITESIWPLPDSGSALFLKRTGIMEVRQTPEQIFAAKPVFTNHDLP